MRTVLILGFLTMVSILPAAEEPTTPLLNYSVVERGSHHRVLERVEYETSLDGKSVPSKKSYTELATGMHYKNESGEWALSKEEIKLLPNGAGAAAKEGQHKVYFAPDVAANEVIDFETSDGKRLRSRVFGLSYFDTATGESAVIGIIQSSEGELASPNRVIYRNAFDGIDADVEYIYTLAGFEQNIILRTQLPAPDTLGLNPQTTKLQVLTEFFDPPTPTKQAVAQSSDLVDESLAFGEMEMGKGRAFSVGEELEAGSVPVSKAWIYVDTLARTFLVEEVPLTAVENQLNALPAKRRQASSDPSRRGRGRNVISALGSLLAKRAVPALNAKMQLAKLTESPGAGFVLDYSLLNAAQTNFTFAGNTNYLVVGVVNLHGTTTIEGGTVVKFTNSITAQINIAGPVRCLTGPYRPAVFTSKDDNTIGETIPGSTGNPMNLYGSGIKITTIGNTLTNVRFAYLNRALTFETGNAGELNVGNAQFVKCRYPLSAKQTMCFLNCGATIRLDNALVLGCDNLFQGDIGILRAQHLTVNQCNYLAIENGSDSLVYLTNSLLVAVTNWGDIPYTTNATAYFATDPGGIFQTVGAGAHYLAANSPYRNAGTTNINASLRTELAKLTTYPPLVYASQLISDDLVLSVQAQRDTDTPDLGYHYDPLDHAFGGLRLTNATLTVTPGTALGFFSVGNGYGLGLLSGSKFNSLGTPLLPNWNSRYHLVQEQANLNWTNVNSDSSIHGNWLGGPTSPEMNCRFTKWSAAVDSNGHLNDYGPMVPLRFTDSEFHGGRFVTVRSSASFTNCLFNRASATFDDGIWGVSFDLTLRNCLFYGGSMEILHWESGDFVFRDTFLDRTTVNQDGDVDITHGGYTPGTTRITPTNANDVVVALTWLSGPLGHFYQPTNSAFVNTGSVANASQIGLYHFTVTTNLVSGLQIKETNSKVDIGYHYVAVGANGLPIDTDGDGFDDYFEDTNGNGSYDSSTELSNWQNGDTDGDGVIDQLFKVIITQPRNGGGL